jgi:hypothetical protein
VLGCGDGAHTCHSRAGAAIGPPLTLIIQLSFSLFIRTLTFCPRPPPFFLAFLYGLVFVEGEFFFLVNCVKKRVSLFLSFFGIRKDKFFICITIGLE